MFSFRKQLNLSWIEFCEKKLKIEKVLVTNFKQIFIRLLLSEYHSIAQELANVQAEAVDAEYFAETQKHSHEARAKEQGEAAETANEAFKYAKTVLQKLVKDKEG